MRLPDISSEDLEHIEDAKLDLAFEERLLREGDDLKMIKTAPQIIAKITSSNAVSSDISTNGASTATAKAKSAYKIDLPDYSNESEENPILPENASEEELFKYAENHPKIKMALRIFRGKIIKVEKSGT